MIVNPSGGGGGDIPDGSITEVKLDANLTTKVNAVGSVADLSITEAKLADGAVTFAKIGVSAVTNTRIGPNAVTHAKMASDAIESHNIKDLNVTEAKINTGAVTNTKLGALAVTHDKIDALAVVEGKIGALAVTEGKINTGAVTNTKLGSECITYDKLGTNSVTEIKISDGVVTNTKLGTNAVTHDKIYPEAVINSKIGALAVTYDKIYPLAVTEAKINTGAVTNTKLGALAVTHDKIDALAITEGKINTGAVTNTKLGDLSISDGKIQVGTITEAKLATAVQTKLNAGGGTIADGSVTLQKLSSAVQTILSTLQQPRGIITIFSPFTSTKPFIYDIKKYNSATSTYDLFTFGDVIAGGSVSNYFILPTTATHMKIELNTIDEKLNTHTIAQGATQISSARGGRDLVIALDTTNGYDNIIIGYEVVLNTNVGWYGTFRVNNINTTSSSDTGQSFIFSIYVGSTQIVASHLLENNTTSNSGTTSFDYVFEKWARLATSSSTIRFVLEGVVDSGSVHVDDVSIFGGNMNVVSGTLWDEEQGDAQLQMGVFTYPFNVRIDVGLRYEV